MTSVVRSLAAALVLGGVLASGGEPPREAPKVKMPAEETRKVKVPIYNPASGDLEWVLLAAKVVPSPGNPRVLLGTDVQIIGYRKGRTQTATARKGSVDTETRAAMLEGDVVLDLQDEQPTRVQADNLTWDKRNGTAWTKGPVRITRSDAAITGLGLRLWVTSVEGEGGKAERTGQLVIERQVRTELLSGANTSLLQATASETKEPLLVTCDGSLTLSRSELLATFRERVRATQGAQTLTCDVLAVKARPVPGEKGKTALESAQATGNVRLDDTRTVATAESAEWQREEGSMKLLGRPAEIRWDNGNRITAGLIHRMGDGAETVCSATPDYPRDVYLLAYTVDRGAHGREARLPYQLGAEHVADWPAFCATLARQGAAAAPSPAKRLWELLPEGTRGILRGAAQGNVLGDRRKAEAVAALNEMLKKPGFYREADFKGVPLPPEAAELLKLDPKAMDEAQARKLNRLLLEAAFPGQIAKAQEPKPQAREEKPK